ncbi:hypothetical protein F383_33177 [Gossypium arboreum]|uniref:Uncharacterized protein n=1 Tax=Gossypium arboreum TaxID=29729 RepID=A0A0B0N214_GOSAR|nr:hypothetical protein F383_33177 [Gossypium arboreum]
MELSASQSHCHGKTMDLHIVTYHTPKP